MRRTGASFSCAARISRSSAASPDRPRDEAHAYQSVSGKRLPQSAQVGIASAKKVPDPERAPQLRVAVRWQT